LLSSPPLVSSRGEPVFQWSFHHLEYPLSLFLLLLLSAVYCSPLISMFLYPLPYQALSFPPLTLLTSPLFPSQAKILFCSRDSSDFLELFHLISPPPSPLPISSPTSPLSSRHSQWLDSGVDRQLTLSQSPPPDALSLTT
jgi:hypothetical protein